MIYPSILVWGSGLDSDITCLYLFSQEPHVIILEPDGYIIWEGFPLQEGYQLTDDILDKILAIGRKVRAKKEAEKPKG